MTHFSVNADRPGLKEDTLRTMLTNVEFHPKKNVSGQVNLSATLYEAFKSFRRLKNSFWP